MIDRQDIAKICHQVNKAFCESIGDFSQPDWSDAPGWQKESAMLGVELHLSDPSAGPEASHASWYNQKISEGWVYGTIKDSDKKEHPCLVPFSELPENQKSKDYIFRAIVLSLKQFIG